MQHKIKTYFYKEDYHSTLCGKFIHRHDAQTGQRCKRCDNYDNFYVMNIDDNVHTILFLFRGLMYEIEIDLHAYEDEVVSLSMISSLSNKDLLYSSRWYADDEYSNSNAGQFDKLVEAIKLYYKSDLPKSVELSQFLIDSNLMVIDD